MKTKRATAKRKYKRLSPTMWAEIEAHWQSGEMTLEDLAAEYGVATRTLQTHFKKHKVSKGEKAQELVAAAHEAVLAENLDDIKQRERKAREFRWKTIALADRIEAVVAQQVEAINKAPTFAPYAAIKAMAVASQTLQRTHQTKLSALGLEKGSDSDELPSIEIFDLGAEELTALQEKHRSEYGDDSSGSEADETEEENEIVAEVRRGRLKDCVLVAQ